MKKFLTKLLLLVLLCAIVLGGLCLLTFQVAAPQHQGLYTGVIRDKIQRLETLEGPRIVLVGDSNLAFGIDSSMIEEAFQLPVVNLGGHGGLGNEFHLNMARRNIQPGDIVVISTTGYRANGVSDAALMWITVEDKTEYLSMVPQKSHYDMVKTLPKYMYKTLFLWLTGRGNQSDEDAYSRSAFNEYGDNVFPRPATTTFAFHPDSVQPPPITEEGMQLLNAFCDDCTKQGAYCVIAAAPVACDAANPPVEAFEAFEQNLRQMARFDVISDFSDYLFHHTLFFDTPDHMTDEGVILRTQQLIDDLSIWLQAHPEAQP
ncbi:MAG: hypothetical protein J6K73_11495 [Clostridia bacterium]|nr:hypothetical protein [Clostridia bacterium]MBP3650393.1 hypothetical protein [Clostridia bacterium]